jgi:hypothetical protein
MTPIIIPPIAWPCGLSPPPIRHCNSCPVDMTHPPDHQNNSGHLQPQQQLPHAPRSIQAARGPNRRAQGSLLETASACRAEAAHASCNVTACSPHTAFPNMHSPPKHATRIIGGSRLQRTMPSIHLRATGTRADPQANSRPGVSGPRTSPSAYAYHPRKQRRHCVRTR